MKLPKLKNIVAAALIGSCSLAANAEMMPDVCKGQFFNPISDMDWNTFFPITIAGMQMTGGGNTNPPLMQMMPPVCLCPGVFGVSVGIGITYWQPVYISEIERRPGCLSSLGGVSVLSGKYQLLHSEQSGSSGNKGKSTSRMQVHWYEYPVFAMLDMMKSVGCKSSSGYNLAYITEIDPMWQDDLWGAIFAPEAALFTSPIAQLVCAVDAVASSLGFSLDPLFWCEGGWGGVYPYTGNSSFNGDPYSLNNSIQGKFIARNHRLGLSMQTIGPTAICSSHANPIWIKSQYRYNQVAPVKRKGRAVTTGGDGRLFTYPPVTNVPTQEHTVNLIWQGQQCCVPVTP